MSSKRKLPGRVPWSSGLLVWFTACATMTSFGAAALDKNYEAARAALARNDPDQAKTELKLSLQNNPLHGASHFLLASLLAREGNLDQAVVGFQRAMTLETGHAAAAYNLGTIMLWRGEPVLAARLLEEAVSVRPDHLPSYNNLAKAYFEAGLADLAAVGYREVLRRDPVNEIALRNLAALTQSVEPQEPGVGESESPSRLTDDARERVAEPAAPEDSEAAALREILVDLLHVKVTRRGGQLLVTGWTRGAAERAQLDRILAGRADVLDLTGEDAGDPQRMLEIDVIIFLVIGLDSQSIGHNFLRNVEVDSRYFNGGPMAQWSWLFSSAISYQVNIANAIVERVALLARPHLTTLSGTPATFVAGGDIVFKVSGTTSGDIKPYPFGTTLEVTPTLLRTTGEEGRPRVHMVVKAGRKSILPLESIEALASGDSVAFDNVEVTSEAVVGLDQTLILTGLSQRESRSGRSGVPILKSIPVIKYLFSTKTSFVSDLAIIILLTPRDPAYSDEGNRQAMAEFVEKRQAYIRAMRGTEEDMRRFKARYPEWHRLAPNRFASHFFLMKHSTAYRAVSGVDLAGDALDLELLGAPRKQGQER